MRNCLRSDTEIPCAASARIPRINPSNGVGSRLQPGDETMMANPIHLTHEDGFRTEIAEQRDGGLRVTVAAPGGRSWTSDQTLIEDAIAVSVRILSDQRAALDPGIDATGESIAGVAGSAPEELQAQDNGAPLGA